MGGMHHSQMGSLWHCFNHINGNGTGNDIAGCILHPCLRHPQIKSWQLHEQAPWWGAKSISRCRSLRVERDRYHTLCIYVYIYIHISNSQLFTHCSDLFFPKTLAEHDIHQFTTWVSRWDRVLQSNLTLFDEAPDLPEGLTLDASTGRGRFLAFSSLCVLGGVG